MPGILYESPDKRLRQRGNQAARSLDKRFGIDREPGRFSCKNEVQ